MSFGSGLAFAIGVMVAFQIQELATKRGRDELKKEWLSHSKQVESRLQAQLETMVCCLDEIKKRKV